MGRNLSRRQFLTSSLVIGAAVAVPGLGGCTPKLSETGEDASLVFTSGTYQASAEGHTFPITVELTVSENAIEKLEVVENGDTEYISTYAIELLTDDILEYQSLEVDTCTGATLTSMAILQATQACFDQAGAKVKAASSKPSPEQVVGEDVECDVLVIGTGPAGSLAACAAATKDGSATSSSGLKVMVLEQLPYAGGSLVVSGAGIFSIYGDPQHLAGEYDTLSEDAFVRYLKERSLDDPLGCLDEPFQRKCYQSIYPAETLMIDLGAPFSYSEMHIVDPMAHEGEGYSDNAFANLAFLDEKGNVIAENSGPIADIVGKNFPKILGAKDNIELRLSTEAVSFIVEGGEVVGVNALTRDQAANTETTYAIRAKKVIVAPGAPNLNREFLEKHDFDLIDAIPWCGAGSTGKIPDMLEDAGFVPSIIGNGAMCYNGTGPQFAFEDGLPVLYTFPFVNKEGKRYFNESDTFVTDTGRQTTPQPDNTGYAIIDSIESYVTGTEPMYWDGNDGKVLIEYAVERGLATKADTIEELADTIDVPKDVFLDTIARYKAAVAGEQEDEMGANAASMSKLETPPYYAMTVHAYRTEPYIGIQVESGTTKLLTEDGHVIPNVHGCGTLVGPNLFYHRYFQWCGGLTTALATGYLAGSEARDAILGA